MLKYFIVLFILSSCTQTEVSRINEYFNNTIEYKAEPTGIDDWQTCNYTMSTGYGDCEDYVLCKKDALDNLGYNTRILLGYRSGTSTYHAVLAVDTEDNTTILDNIYPYIYNINDNLFIIDGEYNEILYD